MNYIEMLASNPPISLKPDRPASSHLLSWDQLQLNYAAETVKKQREQQLITYAENMATIMKQKQKGFHSQYQKYLQHLLLYQIENDRLRHILSEWDSERNKMQQKCKQLDGTYQHRLQILKIEMANNFQSKLVELASKNNQDLETIKDLYNKRIGELNSKNTNQEDATLKLQLQLDRKNTKIQILQAGNQDILSRLELKSRQLKQKQIQNNQIRDELTSLKDQYQRQRQFSYAQRDRKQYLITELQKQNSEVKQILSNLKKTIEQLGNHAIDLQSQNDRLEQSNKKFAMKCLKLEMELEQVKNRKTQLYTQNNKSPNMSKNSPPKSNGSLQEKHEEPMPKSKSAQINSEIIDLKNYIAELQNKITDEEDRFNKIQIQLKDSISQLKRAKEQIRRQESQLQRFEQRKQKREVFDQANNDKLWAERLVNLQKALDQLNQQWLKKERQLSSLFKNIQQRYLSKLQEQQMVLRDKDRVIADKTDECQKLAQALGEKAMQLGILQAKKK